MSGEIIGLDHWLSSAPGRCLLAWEQACMDRVVADLFGYYALQIGMPRLQGLRANRMAHQWLALGQSYRSMENTQADADADADADINTGAGAGLSAATIAPPTLWAEAEALPFAANSLDLVLLPHTLEHSRDPHAALREVARVLVPDGRVVICGLHATSLWGLREQRARLLRPLGLGRPLWPDGTAALGYWRLRDWLQLLDFEVENARFGCFRPALRSHYWMQRLAWMEGLGQRCWPILGAAYCIVAVKRVHGMRLLEPSWRHRRQTTAQGLPVAQRPLSNISHAPHTAHSSHTPHDSDQK